MRLDCDTSARLKSHCFSYIAQALISSKIPIQQSSPRRKSPRKEFKSSFVITNLSIDVDEQLGVLNKKGGKNSFCKPSSRQGSPHSFYVTQLVSQ